MGDVEDQLRAVDAPDDLAGEPGRTDGAVGEPEELEGHPHAGGSGEVARAGEPLARAGEPAPRVEPRDPRGHGEQVGRAEGAADREPRHHVGLERLELGRAVRAEAEAHTVQAEDFVRADERDGGPELARGAGQPLGPSLDPREAGLAGDRELAVG